MNINRANYDPKNEKEREKVNWITWSELLSVPLKIA